MLTPYYVHALQDHQKKKRPQPQGTYAHALARTRHTSPKGGGACQKVFDHVHDYSFNKKWLNLRASGLPKWGGACLKVSDHIHDYGFNKKQVNLRATGLDSSGG